MESSHNGLTIAAVAESSMPLIYANAAFCRITGFALDEVLGRDCRFLQRGVEDDPGLQQLRAAIRREEGTTVLLRNRRKDGSLFYNELTVSPIRDADHRLTHYVGVQNDVTERVQLEARAQRLHDKLVVQARELVAANEELKAFSYSVSHDLRAPVAALLGFTDALQRAQADGRLDRTAHYLERIAANARRMDVLMDALMGLARVAEGELSIASCDVSAICEELLAFAAAAQAVRVEIEPNLCVHADPGMLRVVLENLVGNALKYSSRVPSPRVVVERHTHTDGRRWICVRDNGAGFDMTQADRLFHPFQRLHSQSEFPGTGIGLATVRRVLGRHGGSIEARSSPGAGATFLFTFDPLPG